jgi:hypothetical protein
LQGKGSSKKGPSSKRLQKLQEQLNSPAAADEMVNALHLIANLDKATVAGPAFEAVQKSRHFRSMQAELGAQTVQQLMSVAAARGHVDMLRYAVQQPAAAQVPAAAYASMIRVALHRACRHDGSTGCTVLKIVCKAVAQATEQLDDAAAAQLLRLALLLERPWRKDSFITPLTCIPALQQLPIVVLEQLVQQAAKKGGGDAGQASLSSLTKLLAARDLLAAAVHDMLQRALLQNSKGMVNGLLQSLPAARELNLAVVASLLQLAFSLRSSHAPDDIEALADTSLVPAAAELDSNALVQLVQTAEAADTTVEAYTADEVEHNAAGVTAKPGAAHTAAMLLPLLRLPCVQQLQVEQLQQLLDTPLKAFSNTTITGNTCDVMKQLLATPAAEQLPASAAAAALAAALERQKSSLVKRVCELPGAAEMTPQQLQPVLLRAVQLVCKATATPAPSNRQPAPAGPTAEQVAKQEFTGAIMQVLQLPAATELDSTAVASLLAAAIGCDSALYANACMPVVEAIGALLGAQGMAAQHIASLLQAAEHVADKQVRAAAAAALCALPGAAGLSTQEVGRWLRTALQHSWVEAAAKLCGLQAAAHLPAAVVEGLLWQVLRKGVAYSEDGLKIRQQLQRSVCGLAAAQKLCPSTVMRMLNYAVQEGNGPAVSSLCGLAGAAQIDEAGVAQLLQKALRVLLAGANKQATVAVALCSLQGARQQFSAAIVSRLLKDAVMAKSSTAVAALCKLPCAARAIADTMQDLLQLAGQGGDAAVVEVLMMQS